MLVRNSTGRNVSLLNDESVNRAPIKQRSSVPSISLPFYSREGKENRSSRKDSHASSPSRSLAARSGNSSPTLSDRSSPTTRASLAARYSPEDKEATHFGVTRFPCRPAGPTPLLKLDNQSHSYNSSHSFNNCSRSSTTTTTSSSLPSLSRSSSSTSSSHTPSTPTLSITCTHHLDDMDQAKAAYQPTMLTPSALSTDAFLYGVHRHPIPPPNQYFSIVQQPLPQGPIPLTASSPPMYSLDSPTTSLNMMDSYLPLQQQQQQQAIPYAPYPQELIPGSMSRPSNTQSIIATSPSDTSNNSAPKIAKKKYPCPHAVKYNCSDTFTTSGHAARHGKKHTGEKNIHCPVCDKAFTRKDNMKQHERTHRNKGEASKVAEAVETSKRAAHHQASLSKSSTHSSTEIDTDDNPPKVSNPQATIRAAQQQRRPHISTVQQAPPSLTSPTAADIPMPVTLDSNETLQPVAPSLQVEPMDKAFINIFDHSFRSRSHENILGRPSIFERTTSTGSGFSVDGEGESPGLDALAMAAELC